MTTNTYVLHIEDSFIFSRFQKFLFYHILKFQVNNLSYSRHFMETVCVALSKNPYASVQYKLDTIDWFRQYFNRPEVNEILVHQGAWLEASQ